VPPGVVLLTVIVLNVILMGANWKIANRYEQLKLKQKSGALKYQAAIIFLGIASGAIFIIANAVWG
jgi:hypothetical protein